MKNKNKYCILLLIITVVYITYSILKGYTTYDLSSALTPLILLPFSLLHCSLFLGIKRTNYFFLLVFAISVFYESMSISTGFPFGDYYYSEKLGLKLFSVPLAIMPTYFCLGYVSWFIANIILNKLHTKIVSLSEVFIISIVASFIMVLWDLVMDPVNSTIKSLWVWTGGGIYFGIPISNFFGWFLCVFTFYFPFTWCCYKDSVSFKENLRFGFLYLPPIIYITIMSKYALCFFFKEDVSIFSQGGEVFSSRNIYGSVSFIGFLTMFPIGIFSLCKIYSYSSCNDIHSKK